MNQSLCRINLNKFTGLNRALHFREIGFKISRRSKLIQPVPICNEITFFSLLEMQSPSIKKISGEYYSYESKFDLIF